jgi:GNAT superfamily N-acetyltransferase
MVNAMKRAKKEISVVVDMSGETVTVTVDGVEAAKAFFTVDGSQIMVTNVDTEEKYRKSGYGRLLMEGLKCVSNQKKLPLVLWASEMALDIKFYEKCGFLHCNDPEAQKRFFFGNLETAEDIANKVGEKDLVYIPQSLNKRKPIINL